MSQKKDKELRSIYKRRWLRLSVAVLGLNLSMPSNGEQVIYFAESPWPPFVVGEANVNAKAEGTVVDLVRLIFSRMEGIESDFEMLPWKRVLSELENGNKDAISFLQYTPERAEFLDFTDALFSSESMFFYSKKKYPDGIHWHKLEDLTGYQIGLVADYAASTRLNKAIEDGIDLNLQKIVGTDDQLFHMLQKQRIDLFVCNIDVGYAIIQQYGWQNEIGMAEEPIQSVDFHMAFSKKKQHHKLIRRINFVISELRAEGLILLDGSSTEVN